MTKPPTWPLQARLKVSGKIPQQCPTCSLPEPCLLLWFLGPEEEMRKSCWFGGGKREWVNIHLFIFVTSNPCRPDYGYKLKWIVFYYNSCLSRFAKFGIICYSVILGNCPGSDQNHAPLLVISSKAYSPHLFRSVSFLQSSKIYPCSNSKALKSSIFFITCVPKKN